MCSLFYTSYTSIRIKLKKLDFSLSEVVSACSKTVQGKRIKSEGHMYFTILDSVFREGTLRKWNLKKRSK